MMSLKPCSVLLFSYVWITVMLCLLVLQNTSLKNSRKFRTILLLCCSTFDHVTHLLYSLHWLPVHMRNGYKISSLCFKVLESTAPSYLSDLLHAYTPSRQFRFSSDDRLFRVPRVRTKSYGQRSFAYQGATIWNQPQLSVRHSWSLTSFKTKLKPHLFSKMIRPQTSKLN